MGALKKKSIVNLMNGMG